MPCPIYDAIESIGCGAAISIREPRFFPAAAAAPVPLLAVELTSGEALRSPTNPALMFAPVLCVNTPVALARLFAIDEEADVALALLASLGLDLLFAPAGAVGTCGSGPCLTIPFSTSIVFPLFWTPVLTSNFLSKPANGSLCACLYPATALSTLFSLLLSLPTTSVYLPFFSPH